MDGDDGVVDVQFAGKQGLDFEVRDEGRELLEGLDEIFLDLVSLELQERIQVAYVAVKLAEGGEAQLQGPLFSK